MVLQVGRLVRLSVLDRTVPAASLAFRYLTSTSATFREEGKPKGIPYTNLKVGVARETFPLERRVAASPESVSRLVKPGFQVLIEKGAGEGAHFTDEAYQAAGATIVDDVWKDSDIVLKVRHFAIVSTLFGLARRWLTLFLFTIGS
jgi:NAD(P) transhydrogenase